MGGGQAVFIYPKWFLAGGMELWVNISGELFWFLAELGVPVVVHGCMGGFFGGAGAMRRGLDPCLVLCPLWVEQDAENADLVVVYMRNVLLGMVVVRRVCIVAFMSDIQGIL